MRQVERCRLGERVSGGERQGGQGLRRDVVDDGSPGKNQGWQEGLGHAVHAEKVDGQVPFEHGTIAQVIKGVHAGVVDEDVERFDTLDRDLNVRPVRHVQGQRRNASVRVR